VLVVRCWLYVDGFNLYHGAVKPCGKKWVDLLRLGQQLRKADTIERIKYFTALVENRTDDPGQQRRQRLYWRALGTLPGLQRIEGQFTSHPRPLPLYDSVELLRTLARRGCDVTGIRPTMMKMLRSEEKGTDVNLAVHLVNDAHQEDAQKTFELAVVVSADSDLCEAIRIVTHEVGKPVFVYTPNDRCHTAALRAVATNVFSITQAKIRASQFPMELQDARGRFVKPVGW
jgi:uncharacterized LabA/DUF88 family protein